MLASCGKYSTTINKNIDKKYAATQKLQGTKEKKMYPKVFVKMWENFAE